MQDDYWEQSAEPLTSLCFVAPLLLLYEAGMIWLSPVTVRNGADVWLREMLATCGLGEHLFLPALTCALLLGWHHLTRRTWKIQTDVISGMVCESVLLGICLVVLAHVYAQLANDAVSIAANGTALVRTEQLPNMLSFLGAGIYEELLFRLLLLSGMILLSQKLGVDTTSAVVLSVVATSLLFASAHYRLFFDVGGEFTWYSFVFRLSAGAFFSVLFLRRGFGIAVGTHATYDVLVATLS